MRFVLKYLTLRHYIRYMRKQSKHVQHVHGFVFAGIVTAAIAAVLMYTKYGFWHETYHAYDPEIAKMEEVESESLGQSFSRFILEAKTRFGAIGEASAELLEGKETYTKEP